MGKATKEIENRLSSVDVIIEMRDARIPLSSANPLLESFAARRHRLILLNKADLADTESQPAFRDHLLKHIRREPGKNLQVYHVEAAKLCSSRRLAERLVEQAAKLVSQPSTQQQQRLAKPPALVSILVCGIPNVGKSTLINAFKARKVAATGRSPGITRSVGQAIPLDPPPLRPGHHNNNSSSRPPMFLIDTPGVMLPRITDPLIGLKLAAVDAIAAKQTDPQIVGNYIFQQLCARGAAGVVYTVTKLKPLDDEAAEHFHDLLARLAKRTGADLQTAAEQFVRLFQRGSFGRISLDTLVDSRTESDPKLEQVEHEELEQELEIEQESTTTRDR